MISADLLKIMCCPVDKADLNYDEDGQTLTCKKCKHQYQIREGIPILLPLELMKAEKK